MKENNDDWSSEAFHVNGGYNEFVCCVKNQIDKGIWLEVHQHEYSQRTNENKESCREYLYKIMAIAIQTKNEIESVIQYIIDGIPDTEFKKVILNEWEP